MYDEGTIAAIATPPGEGGVGIVRISGAEAFDVADRIFAPLDGTLLSARPHGTFVYGRVTDSAGLEIDAGLALVMRAPKSYTREDVVEIQGHGGGVTMRRILRAIIEAGARPAEPGEFTKRAFLNGRIDLLQAEGICELIRARSDRAASAALEQLEGRLSRRFDALYDALIGVAADLETTLDFAEEELPESVFSDIVARTERAGAEVEALLETWDEGRLLREGARVTIMGRPNAGKSTLLNALLGFDRAIVSAIPGTTRDTIEESFVLDGIPLRLTDTAGLRETDCEIEAEGIRRAEAHGAEARLALYVLDASVPLEEEDLPRLKSLAAERLIVVLNKVDLGRGIDPSSLPPSAASVETDALSGKGIDALERAMAEVLERGIDLHAPPRAVVSERHRELLLRVREELDSAQERLREGVETNAVEAAEHLRCALDRLGRATGRVYHDELLDNVFSRFCVGK